MADDLILMSQTTEGIAQGKARRKELPRKALGELGQRHSDFDPVDCLVAQGIPRVQDLLPLRYERMAASKFAFLRGAAAVMAYDLAMTPNTQIEVQLCGDAHVSNFGIFAAPDRRLVFDVNDFDETLPGPFEWDVKRMCASAVVAMQDNGFSDSDARKVVQAAASFYRTSILELAQMPTMDVWYLRVDVEELATTLKSAFKNEQGLKVDSLIAKAKRSNSQRAYTKSTSFTNGRLRFTADPPVVVPIEDLRSQGWDVTEEQVIRQALDGYAASLAPDRAHLVSTFEPVDMARKVVGVGSVGTRCFLLLLLGRSMNDPLILQIKEAMPSVLEAHLGPSTFETAGQRVVAGQRLMQTSSDIFLGDYRATFPSGETHDFYFRQYHDAKASVDFTGVTDPKVAEAYFKICAGTLARAHARSGNRAAIASYLGDTEAFDKAIITWSMAYAEQNAADYKEFTRAIASGRLPSMPAS